MAESAGDTQASEVIPAGHAAPARERRRSGDGPPVSSGAAGLGLAVGSPGTELEFAL